MEMGLALVKVICVRWIRILQNLEYVAVVSPALIVTEMELQTVWTSVHMMKTRLWLAIVAAAAMRLTRIMMASRIAETAALMIHSSSRQAIVAVVCRIQILMEMRHQIATICALVWLMQLESVVL
jgi:hypothetical protein